MGEKRILMGILGRAHGVRGHVRVTSYTAEPADLDEYNPFEDDHGRRIELAWVADNIAEITCNGVLVRDRTGAEALVNTKLTIDRDRLPATDDAEEFYLADLVGLQAVTPDGATLGEVTAVLDFGAGASLEIGALLVPFTHAAVPEIDIAGKKLVVIPPAEATL